MKSVKKAVDGKKTTRGRLSEAAAKGKKGDYGGGEGS